MIAESVEDISGRVQNKRCKGSIALQRAEASARRLDASIEARLGAASDRKETMTAEKVGTLADGIRDKMERGRAALRVREATARELDASLENRMRAATSRREKNLGRSPTDGGGAEREKPDRAFDVRRRSEDAARMLDEAIRSRLSSADARKHGMIASAVEQASATNRAKAERAAQKARMDMEASLRLRDKIETKLAKAADRKAEQLASAAKQAGRTPRQPADSPAHSSPTKEEIDERLNDAAARREAFLRSRSHKKTSGRGSPPEPSPASRPG